MFNALPDDLRIAVSVAVTEPEFADLGNDELRHLARHILLNAPLDPAVIEILEDTLDEWMAQQAGLQERARAAFEQLVDTDWVDIENARFPEWRTHRWARTLTQPWSERLAEAVLDAEAHLAASE
jgi:hypothetical protein